MGKKNYFYGQFSMAMVNNQMVLLTRLTNHFSGTIQVPFQLRVTSRPPVVWRIQWPHSWRSNGEEDFSRTQPE